MWNLFTVAEILLAGGNEACWWETGGKTAGGTTADILNWFEPKLHSYFFTLFSIRVGTFTNSKKPYFIHFMH